LPYLPKLLKITTHGSGIRGIYLKAIHQNATVFPTRIFPAQISGGVGNQKAGERGNMKLRFIC
jgi:hypothetical protein